MKQVTTHWDRPPTDKELDRFYGKAKPWPSAADQMREALTETIRKSPPEVLAVACVSYQTSVPKLSVYSVKEVIQDFGVHGSPIDALMKVLHKSDCPLVEAYRQAIADAYISAMADEVDQLMESDDDL